MATQKFKQFYQLMLEQQGQIFADFQPVHDAYAANPDDPELAEAFHTQGRKVLDIVRDWERRLCSGMERGRYAQYSNKVSEKFWDEVKKTLPLVEEIGVKTRKI